MLDQSNDAIFLLSIPEGKFVDVNRSACEQLGYDCRDLLEMSVDEIICDSSTDIKDILSDKVSSIVFIGPLCSQAGEKIPYEINAYKVYFGGKAYATMVARNIEKRLLIERELRESEDKFRVLAEMSSAVIYVYQGEHLVYVNKATERITGYPRDELLKMTFWEIIHPDFKEMVKERGLARQRGEPAPSSYEIKFIAKNGETRWAELTAGYIEYIGKPAGVATFFDITRRKQTEESLKKLSSVVEQSPSTVIITDINGKIEYVNSKFTQLTGYTFEEVKGKSPSILKSGHTRPDEYKLIWETIMSGKEWRGEFLNKKKNGELYWEKSIIFPVTDTSGKIANLIAIKEDVTERKRMNEDLSYLATYPVLNPNPIIEVNITGTINYLNRVASELFPDITTMQLRHPMLEGLEEIIAKITKENITSFVREVKVDSSYYQETIIKLPEKEIVRIYTTDITERKHAEEKMRLTQFAVDNFTDSSIWLSPDGRIIYANKITCKNLGYTSDELLSMMLWDIDPDYNYERQLKTWNELKQKGTLKFESTHVRKDGTSYPVELSVKYLKFEDKEYIVTFDRNITVRKQNEKELSDAKAQSEMYLDLMGHDINNLNQVALGYLELADDLIKSGGKLGDNIELIEKPIESLHNSSKLIDNVMKLRKIKIKEFRLDRVDICQVLAKICDRYSHVGGREVTINYTPPAECLVMANELIDEIFINLIENSIKHSYKDRPLVIDVSQATVYEDDKEYFMISIEDNGPGISDEVKQNLFARFSRGKTKAKGKGLGLYLIKTLVENFHGKVRVEDSVPGDHTKGAKFVVILPAVE